MVQPTERAVQVVVAAQSAARRFDPTARIRLVREGPGVRFALADAALPGDVEVRCGDVVLLVEFGLEGVLDAGDHNAPVMRPTTA